MYVLRLLIPAVVIVAGVNPAWAVDLTKIERTIAKEPAYETKPKYCLLVFGPEAKARAWLVIDGNTLYVDRACNGDLTGSSKQADVIQRVAKAGDITQPDGKTKHTGLLLTLYSDASVCIAVDGKTHWYANGLVFADRPQDAPIIHFGGPLTLGRVAQNRPLRGTDFHVNCSIGAPGLGKGTFAWIKTTEMPEGARATAIINFPGPKVGDEPLSRTIHLKPDT